MNTYGKVFRIIRKVKNIPPKQAAHDLGIDERSLRDIENDKTTLITQRFTQLCDYYEVTPKLIFDMAAERASTQNIVYEATLGTGIIFNQGQVSGDLPSTAAVRPEWLDALKSDLANIRQQLETLAQQQQVILERSNP